MNVVDWVIVAFALLLMPIGYRQGFLVGALTLAGFGAGAFLGSRVGPLLLEGGAQSPYAPLSALVGGLMIGGLLALMLEAVGLALRDRVVRGRLTGTVDAVGGAAVLAALALAVSWVLGAVALNTPAFKDLRDDVQRSAILGALNDTLPPSGPVLNVLNRIVPTPELPGPPADVAAPPRGILGEPGLRAATGSVVQILGNACGLNVAGSGWVAAPDLVITNAHVIAGQDATRVRTRDGAELDATAVAYRPRDDIAALRVSGLGLQPLELAGEPQAGTPGGVAGFPGGGGFDATPARLGETATVRSEDSYGRGPVQRSMTSFRARVVSGNSGGPVIDAQGRVLTTVFASSLSAQRPEGLGVPNAVTRELLARIDGPVGTGACA